MEIFFRTRKLQEICSTEREMQRALGMDCARKLAQRLMELRAATVLADISRLPPPRLHEHVGSGKGTFSVDVQQPYRLLFIAADDPVPRDEDGIIDLNAVTAIEIISIEDPH